MACGRYLPTLKAHKGWTSTGEPEDLEDLTGSCEACGNDIRFVHTITHPEHPPIGVGVVCAGNLTGDYVNPARRDKEMRARANRKKREQQRYCGYYNNLPWTPLPPGLEGGCAKVGDTWIKVKKLKTSWVVDWTRVSTVPGKAAITRSAFIKARSFIEAAHKAVWQFA